jgi:hypothetical protein
MEPRREFFDPWFVQFMHWKYFLLKFVMIVELLLASL